MDPTNVMFYDVESSNVSQIGYDDESMNLWVRFNNGYLYWYAGVDPGTWDMFLQTESKGKFIHQYLKGQYEYGRYE